MTASVAWLHVELSRINRAHEVRKIVSSQRTVHGTGQFPLRDGLRNDRRPVFGRVTERDRGKQVRLERRGVQGCDPGSPNTNQMHFARSFGFVIRDELRAEESVLGVQADQRLAEQIREKEAL